MIITVTDKLRATLRNAFDCPAALDYFTAETVEVEVLLQERWGWLKKAVQHIPDALPDLRVTAAGRTLIVARETVRHEVRAGDDAIVLVRGDEDGDVVVYGPGRGDAYRHGSGLGDAYRDGKGRGHAFRDGNGSGSAYRDGKGRGDAFRFGNGRGDARRDGPGDGDAYRRGRGYGFAFRDGSGRGHVYRHDSDDVLQGGSHALYDVPKTT